MQQIPHDVTDLMLAPVALQIDERLDRLGALEEDELVFLIALETDREPRDFEQRRALLLESLERDVDTRGWALDWDPRGLRLEHDGRGLVLGLPPKVRDFVGS